MKTLMEEIPGADVVLAHAPEELGKVLLRLARECEQHNREFHPAFVMSESNLPDAPRYPQNLKGEIEIAVAEAWAWLRIHLLIVDAPGANGNHGWMTLSRRGRALLADASAFDSYRQAAAFPKELLHPSIADKVWVELARGNLDEAVFHAFKTVEVAVREAAGDTTNDYGVKLMRKAFNKDSGPLADMNQEEGERDGLMQLFAGAIASYKNPHSHRHVGLPDHREAQEMVLLASHLLRIVDARRR